MYRAPPVYLASICRNLSSLGKSIDNFYAIQMGECPRYQMMKGQPGLWKPLGMGAVSVLLTVECPGPGLDISCKGSSHPEEAAQREGRDFTCALWEEDARVPSATVLPCCHRTRC